MANAAGIPAWKNRAAPRCSSLVGALLVFFGMSCGNEDNRAHTSANGEAEPAEVEHAASAAKRDHPPEAEPAVQVALPPVEQPRSDGDVGKAENTTATNVAEAANTTDTKAETAPEPAAAPAPTDEEAKPDPAALLKEAKVKATTDERALAALAEAETAGATAREVAKAAFDRAKTLHATPERAASFLRFAADKDPKAPDAVFALAKQAAITGDVDETVRLLKDVKERKGDKLLREIEYDPTWEIVKDDPAVRALF